MLEVVNKQQCIDKQSIKRHLPGAVFLLLVISLIVWLLSATLGWMVDEQRLPLSKLIIQGDLYHVDDSDVRYALQSVDTIGTFMTQDVDQLQNALLALPWISHVSVRKQWPDTIKVFAVEHQAAAIWNNEQLLNADGDIFNGKVSELQEKKVSLYGPEASSHEVLNVFNETEQRLKSLSVSLKSVVLSERRAWQMELSNGIRIELGRDARNERIARFIALYQRIMSSSKPIEYIDLRYDTGAAVGWKVIQELDQESGNE
ncbi:cell division protein FtsQ/DivIB [Aliivibrio kagoshimensis]|uniref:cell division protein FtsQ/DivIB n=1 Tax=Aliivibrio kagoshimensis TaxID=2910230 RepID=UPI003D138181